MTVPPVKGNDSLRYPQTARSPVCQRYPHSRGLLSLPTPTCAAITQHGKVTPKPRPVLWEQANLKRPTGNRNICALSGIGGVTHVVMGTFALSIYPIAASRLPSGDTVDSPNIPNIG